MLYAHYHNIPRLVTGICDTLLMGPAASEETVDLAVSCDGLTLQDSSNLERFARQVLPCASEHQARRIAATPLADTRPTSLCVAVVKRPILHVACRAATVL